MPKKPIIAPAWARIIGNTIAAFCTVAIAININGTPDALAAAFYAAGITALLAFAKEMQQQGQEEGGKTKLASLLLF